MHRIVAIVSAEASVGQYLLDGFIPVFTELGGEVSYSGPVTQSSLRQVISADVDAIVIAGSFMNSGVSKSGSPAPNPITSFPAAFNSLAF